MSTSRDLDNAVRGSVRTAPSFSPSFTVNVQSYDGGWLLTSPTHRTDLSHGQVVTAGAAAQSVVLAVEAAGRRAQIEVLADDRPAAIAAVHVLGPGPSRRPQDTTAQTPEPATRQLQPSDLRHLNLCVEAFGCELLWQHDAARADVLERAQRVQAAEANRPMSTVVTRGDGPADWFEAGRAMRALALVAAGLGFRTRPAPHALGQRETRRQVKSEWDLKGWPQAQLILETIQPDF